MIFTIIATHQVDSCFMPRNKSRQALHQPPMAWVADQHTATSQRYPDVYQELHPGKFISFVQPRIDYTYRADYQYYKDKEEYLPGAHYLLYDLYITSFLRC